MKGVVNFGAVDMDQHRAAGEPYGVSSYPTIKLFGRNKNKPKDFVGGERTFDKFVDFTIAAMKE